jgi:hypothetical protein
MISGTLQTGVDLLEGRIRRNQDLSHQQFLLDATARFEPLSVLQYISVKSLLAVARALLTWGVTLSRQLNGMK